MTCSKINISRSFIILVFEPLIMILEFNKRNSCTITYPRIAWHCYLSLIRTGLVYRQRSGGDHRAVLKISLPAYLLSPICQLVWKLSNQSLSIFVKLLWLILIVCISLLSECKVSCCISKYQSNSYVEMLYDGRSEESFLRGWSMLFWINREIIGEGWSEVDFHQVEFATVLYLIQIISREGFQFHCEKVPKLYIGELSFKE